MHQQDDKSERATVLSAKSTAPIKRQSPSRAVSACLSMGRPPSAAEIDRVAERIAHEVAPDGPAWQDLPVSSPVRAAFLHAARVALGVGRDGDATERPLPAVKKTRKPLSLRWS